MQDSIHAIIQSGNLYMFCMHNPVMFRDPTGLYYIIAWSFANSYLEPFTDSYGNVDWDAFTAVDSFARAAYSERARLIARGISQDSIIVRRVNSATDLESAWSEWLQLPFVHELHIFSHGYAGGPIMAGGGGGAFLLAADRLAWSGILYQGTHHAYPGLPDGGRMISPFAGIYGCNTANGAWAQSFANSQRVRVYAQNFYSSFSHNPRIFSSITHHGTSHDIYLLSFDGFSWLTGLAGRRTGLTNTTGRGVVFTPN